MLGAGGSTFFSTHPGFLSRFSSTSIRLGLVINTLGFNAATMARSESPSVFLWKWQILKLKTPPPPKTLAVLCSILANNYFLVSQLNYEVFNMNT